MNAMPRFPMRVWRSNGFDKTIRAPIAAPVVVRYKYFSEISTAFANPRPIVLGTAHCTPGSPRPAEPWTWQMSSSSCTSGIRWNLVRCSLTRTSADVLAIGRDPIGRDLALRFRQRYSSITGESTEQ